jgi:hypothetical protein
MCLPVASLMRCAKGSDGTTKRRASLCLRELEPFSFDRALTPFAEGHKHREAWFLLYFTSFAALERVQECGASLRAGRSPVR